MSVFGVWLGGKPMSATAKHCVSTWPDDAEIFSAASLSSVVPRLRDEPYFRDAYAANHWAGASDIARLALLYELGGCYLDVDVEIVSKPGLSKMFDGRFHIGKEDAVNVCGAVMIAPPKHPFVARMLDIYRNTKFSDTFNGRVNGTTLLTRAVFREWASEPSIVVHEPHVFYPWHWSSNPTSADKSSLMEETKGVVCGHHWEHQWKQVNT